MSLLSVLQENLLVLLTFDDERSRVIRNTIAIELFGGLYKTFAVRIYDYIDKYQKAPGEHLPDIMVDKLEDTSKREIKLYTDIIENIYDAKDGINAEYVMSQLETFVKRQSLRTVAIDLTKALQRDTEDSLDEAFDLIRSANTKSLTVFDPGTRLDDQERALNFLNTTASSFMTGIPELDRRNLGPARKELWLGIGNKKAGKTWMLIHLAKIAMLNRLKVVHITLEMSEEKTIQRYFQTFFSIAKRKGRISTTKFKKNKKGRLVEFDERMVKPKHTFADKNIDEKLSKLLRKWQRTLKNIIVKEFPTGSLTLKELEAYLDNLESTQRFVPDLLIVDYPDIMKKDPRDPRASLDHIFIGLRGLGVKRNIGVATVSQSNRLSEKAKTVTGIHIGEDYRKLQHCDVGVTYSQTAQEKRLGLARLTVIAARNDESGFSIALSQRYGTGHFAVDSVMMNSTYWERVGTSSPENNEDES